MHTKNAKDYDELAVLELKNITKFYKHEEEEKSSSWFGILKRKEDLGVRDVTFDIAKGQIIGLIGQKKSGKSTLLKIISGVLKPSSGKIIYMGESMSDNELRDVVSYITNEGSGSESGSSTVLENMIQYACRDNRASSDAVETAENLLRAFGMLEYMYKEINHLPSGILNQIFIVRGFLSHKQVLCFDQPFNYLEGSGMDKFIVYAGKAAKEGKSIVITDNNKERLNKLCDLVILL